MRRVIHLMVFGLAAILPSVAFADGLEVRAGAMFPVTGKATGTDCQSGCNLFADLDELFGATRSGWAGPVAGIEVSRRVSGNVELGIHIDGYGRKRYGHYRSDKAPRDLEQTLQLSYVPIGLSLRLLPAGAHAKVSPYLSAGPDIVIWQYQEHGDYFDFDTRKPFYDEFEAKGATPGLHVAAGLRLPITYDFALTSEVRYLWTAKVAMGGHDEPYEPYDIQPGGVSATFGVMLRF
jgi:hypothetical protein